MKLIGRAAAGAAEGSDVLVEVAPHEGGIRLELKSALGVRFADAIRASVMDVLCRMEVTDAIVRVDDYGALDWILRARVEAAVLRGKEAQP